MQFPIGIGAQLLDTFSADLGGEQLAEPIRPEADRHVTDINPSLMQQVFNLPQRKWKAEDF